MNSSLLITGKI